MFPIAIIILSAAIAVYSVLSVVATWKVRKKEWRIAELERENNRLRERNGSLEISAESYVNEFARLYHIESQWHLAVDKLEVGERLIQKQNEVIENLRRNLTALEGEYRMFQILTEKGAEE